jgi:hypothetical protein
MGDVYALAAAWVRDKVPMDEMTEAHIATAKAYAAALAERLDVATEWARTRNTEYQDAEGKRYQGDIDTAETRRYRITLDLVIMPPEKESNRFFEQWTSRSVTIHADGTLVVKENRAAASTKAMLSDPFLSGGLSASARAALEECVELAETYHANLPPNLQVKLATYLQ